MAYIPQLLGEKAESDKPYAELWIGAHPSFSSEIVIDEVAFPLYDIIQKFPKEILGEYVLNNYSKNLPFLFKVLSAAEALSIQAHPNKQQAISLYARDPEHYPDDNHKPEIAVALDHLDALVGLKSLDEIKAALQEYAVFQKFYGEVFYSKLISGESGREDELKSELYQKTMQLGEDENLLRDVLGDLESLLSEKENLKLCEKYFLENRKIFGDDVGLLSFFLYNLISLNENEGFFTDAGIPHAYLKGNIIECMANSDNVIRAGMTPKYKDVESLLSLINISAGKPEIIEGKGKEIIYTTKSEEFELKKILMTVEEQRQIETLNRVQICFVLKGEVVVANSRAKKYNFIQGESFLLPGIMKEYSLTAVNDSDCIIVSVP